MNDAEMQYNDWLNACMDDLVKTNTLANEQFGIGGYERWDMSQDTGQFVSSNEGKVVVTADASIVGSYSFISRTWLWGWANNSILPRLTQNLAAVKQYGEEHGLPDLTEPKWEGDEQDGWAMAATALRLAGGEAVYCGPSENGLTFLLLRNLRWAAS